MTDYLPLAEALAIHDDQIERYGGSPGIRDPGLLEAALITADAEAAYGFIAGLYEAGDFTFVNLAAWLRANVAL